MVLVFLNYNCQVSLSTRLYQVTLLMGSAVQSLRLILNFTRLIIMNGSLLTLTIEIK